MKNIEHKYHWTEWQSFPNPKKGDYLYVPFGMGVYQLKNSKTNEYILFGKGKNLAYRMASLLPKPFGQGTRNNNKKREYVLNHIDNIIYRTVAFTDESQMKICEQELKQLNIHKYNT